jgi:UDP-2,3-diacylglucosamine pyrophosphatase LpxH
MKFSEFFASFKELLETSPAEELNDDSKYLFLSDLHMGDGGKTDDLRPNRGIVQAALARYYLEQDYILVLGGDIEDLSKFKLREIRSAWYGLYAIFNEFAQRGALRKILGNHDLALLREEDYPYELLHWLRLVRKGKTIFAFHGHQASRVFVRYRYLSNFIVRYLAKPFRIKNTSISSDSRHRFKAERRVYRASKRLGIVSLSGHTHRPLFESLSKYENLRWKIEELLRGYAESGSEGKDTIAELIRVYRAEYERLGRAERKRGLSRSLYEERDVLIPCLFNSGCATGKSGFTAVELAGGSISLVHWTDQTRPREYLEREALAKESLDGSPCTRYVLRRDGLDEIFARIELMR